MRRFPNPKCFLVLEWDDHLCPSCGYDLEPELEKLEKLEKLESMKSSVIDLEALLSLLQWLLSL